MKLTVNMFGSEFNHDNAQAAIDLFGIACGQMRGLDKVGHNLGWYNKAGEKIGWGDVGVADCYRIQRVLENDDVMLFMYESDSFWNFVETPGVIGSMSKVRPTEAKPGVAYLKEKAFFAITKTGFFYSDGHEDREFPAKPMEMRHGFQVTELCRKDFARQVWG